MEIYHTYSKQLCWNISLQEKDPQVICKLKLKLSSFLNRHFLNEIACPVLFSWWVLYFACWKDKTCHRAKQVFSSDYCSKGLNQIWIEVPSVDPTKEKWMDEWMNESRDTCLRKKLKMSSTLHFCLCKKDLYLRHMWATLNISQLYFLSVYGGLYKFHRQSIPVLSITSYCDFSVYSCPQKIQVQWIPMVVNAGIVLWCVYITTEYTLIYWFCDHSQISSEVVWNFLSNTLQFGAYFLVCILRWQIISWFSKYSQ